MAKYRESHLKKLLRIKFDIYLKFIVKIDNINKNLPSNIKKYCPETNLSFCIEIGFNSMTFFIILSVSEQVNDIPIEILNFVQAPLCAAIIIAK